MCAGVPRVVYSDQPGICRRQGNTMAEIPSPTTERGDICTYQGLSVRHKVSRRLRSLVLHGPRRHLLLGHRFSIVVTLRMAAAQCAQLLTNLGVFNALGNGTQPD